MQIKKKCQNYEIKKWSVFFAIERIRRKLSFKGRAKFLIVKGLKTIDISDFPSVEISVILICHFGCQERNGYGYRRRKLLCRITRIHRNKIEIS